MAAVLENDELLRIPWESCSECSNSMDSLPWGSCGSHPSPRPFMKSKTVLGVEPTEGMIPATKASPEATAASPGELLILPTTNRKR